MGGSMCMHVHVCASVCGGGEAAQECPGMGAQSRGSTQGTRAPGIDWGVELRSAWGAIEGKLLHACINSGCADIGTSSAASPQHAPVSCSRPTMIIMPNSRPADEHRGLEIRNMWSLV